MCYHGGSSYINLPELGEVPVTYKQLFNVGDLVIYRNRLNDEIHRCGLIVEENKSEHPYSPRYKVLWSAAGKSDIRSYSEYEMQKNIEKHSQYEKEI